MYPFSLFLGLVIVDARYGPKAYDDETAEGLDVDVTVPLQALVNNSQLCVPGGRSKVSVLEPRFCFCFFVSFFLPLSSRRFVKVARTVGVSIDGLLNVRPLFLLRCGCGCCAPSALFPFCPWLFFFSTLVSCVMPVRITREKRRWVTTEGGAHTHTFEWIASVRRPTSDFFSLSFFLSFFSGSFIYRRFVVILACPNTFFSLPPFFSTFARSFVTWPTYCLSISLASLSISNFLSLN